MDKPNIQSQCLCLHHFLREISHCLLLRCVRQLVANFASHTHIYLLITCLYSGWSRVEPGDLICTRPYCTEKSLNWAEKRRHLCGWTRSLFHNRFLTRQNVCYGKGLFVKISAEMDNALVGKSLKPHSLTWFCLLGTTERETECVFLSWERRKERES